MRPFDPLRKAQAPRQRQLFRLFPMLVLVIGSLMLSSIRLGFDLDECPKEPEWLQDKTILVATLLRNSAHILPAYAKQLLRLARCRERQGKIVVHIVTNDNEDSTPALLVRLENEALKYSNLDLNILSMDGQVDYIISDRIERLTRLRNLALPAPEDFAKIDLALFINDVFWDVEGAYRLAETYERMNASIVCAVDYYYNFYDTWVTRDTYGRNIARLPPYIEDGDGVSPFPVSSCWNGILLTDARPLKAEPPLRFRAITSVRDGECPQTNSECLLFCVDFAKYGLDRFFVDPTVKVFYEAKYYYYHYFVFPFIQMFLLIDWAHFPHRFVRLHPTCAFEPVPILILPSRIGSFIVVSFVLVYYIGIKKLQLHRFFVVTFRRKKSSEDIPSYVRRVWAKLRGRRTMMANVDALGV